MERCEAIFVGFIRQAWISFQKFLHPLQITFGGSHKDISNVLLQSGVFMHRQSA
jgi:hypothetical protein